MLKVKYYIARIIKYARLPQINPSINHSVKAAWYFQGLFAVGVATFNITNFICMYINYKRDFNSVELLELLKFVSLFI